MCGLCHTLWVWVKQCSSVWTLPRGRVVHTGSSMAATLGVALLTLTPILRGRCGCGAHPQVQSGGHTWVQVDLPVAAAPSTVAPRWLLTHVCQSDRPPKGVGAWSVWI